MYILNDILKQFGKNVKAERIRKGFSQETLSEKMNVNREYISRIERGLQNMSLLKITELANYLETDIHQLLKF